MDNTVESEETSRYWPKKYWYDLVNCRKEKYQCYLDKFGAKNDDDMNKIPLQRVLARQLHEDALPSHLHQLLEPIGRVSE